MKALIVGGSGQIGRALVATAPQGSRISAPSRALLDLTDSTSVERVVRDEAPDIILNAAGYTAVDRAEAEPELARSVNECGARVLAEAAAAVGARMLHYSTDYVFRGDQDRPYMPEDPPDPLSVYGATKLAGEHAVLAALESRATVLRTAWVYGPQGHNFLLTMLRLLNERGEASVVSDQIGTPTSASSAARAAWAIAARSELHGVLHWAEDGTASWYDFAAAIADMARKLGLVQRAVAVRPVTSEEYPTPARRPKYSVLDCSKARAATGLVPDHWRTALQCVLKEMARG